MKYIFLAATLSGCVNMTPDYLPPTLITPQNGATFAEFVALEWLPNNQADKTTGDYSFFAEVASDPEFKAIKSNFLTKLETRFYVPLPALKNGVNYWRVTATYRQQVSGGSISLKSDTRYFNYIGNDGAIFVNPSHTGSGILGTKLDPVLTINAAFEVAKRRGLSDIRLGNATYSGTIALGAYTLKGCYDSATWVRNVAVCATTISDAAAVTYYDPLN